MPPRPRRSVLYMPGSNARAIEKAKSLPCDGVILDLEDAVAPEAKESARAQVASALAAGGFGRREVVVRINGLDTPWGADDLAAICKGNPAAVLVPKVSTSNDVGRAAEQIDKNDPNHQIGLWLMMETPLAVLNAKDISATSKSLGSRLSCLVMGTNDLAKEIRIAQTPERTSLLPALGLCVLAARAYGLGILDGVFNSVEDRSGFIASCEQGAALGFDGKTLIHPSQIESCNKCFAPDPTDVEWARRVIAVFETEENKAKNVIMLEGRMVERLHAEEAKRLVTLADAIADAEAAN